MEYKKYGSLCYKLNIRQDTVYESLNKHIEEVIIPEGITHIDANAFRDCKKLKSVIFPKSLKVIEDLAFINCYSLKHIKLYKKIKILGFKSFTNCKNLESVYIEDASYGRLRIENDVFVYCENLKHLVLPTYVKYIKSYVFEGTIFSEVYKKLNTNEFLKFIKLNNENPEKIIDEFIKTKLLTLEDVTFLLNEKEFKGLKEGLNYGV